MMVVANDAAVVLAEEVSGSVTEFAELSTKRPTNWGGKYILQKPQRPNDVTGHVTTERICAYMPLGHEKQDLQKNSFTGKI